MQAVVIAGMQDSRREVREAACRALETTVHKGDTEVEDAMMELYARADHWAQSSSIDAWHLCETICRLAQSLSFGV